MRALGWMVLVGCAGTPAAAKVAGPTTAEVLAQATDADWRALDPENTLYLQVGGGPVVIELAPAFAPANVANVLALVQGGYFDDLRIIRVQDNYVTQWGDPDADDPARARPFGQAKAKVAPEFARAAAGLELVTLEDGDVYAPEVGWSAGFPAARDTAQDRAWMLHCYGAVGVARDVAPDTGNGSQLYAVIGHSPRHLDRNITLVGRVVWGMERLAALPRGTGELGFYLTEAERAPIQVRRASDIPPAERVDLRILRTDTPLFRRYVEARRNRREEWFAAPAGKIEVCNVPPPVRVVGAK